MTDSSLHPPIDITIVSGRRPELLHKTLTSFSKDLFEHFRVARFLVNIDPFAGDEQDHKEVRRVIDRFLPQAKVFEPETACFGAAVKRLWQNTSASIIFHMEDDWVLEKPLHPKKVFPLFDEATKQISLVTREKHWNRIDKFHYEKRRIPFIRIKKTDLSRPIFTTSPSFLCGEFARRSADLMLPELDPEKQFSNGLNPELFAHVAPFRNRFLPAPGRVPFAKDIGREWRREKGLKKSLRNGISTWGE
jgi:hypothetical protein